MRPGTRPRALSRSSVVHCDSLAGQVKFEVVKSATLSVKLKTGRLFEACIRTDSDLSVSDKTTTQYAYSLSAA